MKLRLSQPIRSGEKMLHYFANGPEADGYELSGVRCAPEINEYNREQQAPSGKIPSIVISNAHAGRNDTFDRAAQSLLSGYDLTQHGEGNQALRKINCWDIVIDVPKAVSLITLVQGRKDVLHLVNDLRKNLICDILGDLRIRPTKQEAERHHELLLADRNYLIEFPHFMARAEPGDDAKVKRANSGTTSAIPDPHLHWHHLLPNTGWRFSADDEPTLSPLHIRRMVKTFGIRSALYQNKLISGLQAIGIAARSHPTHQIMIDGIDKSTIERFSQRTKIIEREASHTRYISAKQKALIAKHHRRAKDPSINFSDLRITWGKNFALSIAKSQVLKPLGTNVSTIAIDVLIKEVLEKRQTIPINQLFHNALSRDPSICDIHDLAERINRCTGYVFLQRKGSNDGIVTTRGYYDCARALMAYSNIPCQRERTIVEISEPIAIGFQRSYAEIQKQNTQVFGVVGRFPLNLKPFQKWPQGVDTEALKTISNSRGEDYDILLLNGMLSTAQLSAAWPALQQHLHAGGQAIIQQLSLSGHKQEIGLLDLMQRMGFERYCQSHEFTRFHSLSSWGKIANDFKNANDPDLPYEISTDYEFLFEEDLQHLETKGKGSIFLWFPRGEDKLPAELKSRLPAWALLTGNNVRSNGHDILSAGVVYPTVGKNPLYFEKETRPVGPIILDRNQRRPYINEEGTIYLPKAQVVSGIISYDTKLPKFRSFPRRLVVGLSKDFSLHNALREIKEAKSACKDDKEIELSISVDTKSDLLLSNWRKDIGTSFIEASTLQKSIRPLIARLQEPHFSALPYLSKQSILIRQSEEKKRKEALEKKEEELRRQAAQERDEQQFQNRDQGTIEWDR